MNLALATLTDLYAPIAAELRAVQELFDEELRCDLPFVEALCEQIRHYQGKMLRPALTLLSASACNGIIQEHITLATVLELVHMATLVHDDVLDEADMRRNRHTLNAMSDNEAAVLVGDYLISHAYHLCSSLDSQYASRTIASCTNTVCEGELLQVHHRNNWHLTQEQYFSIISRKTAALTGTACMLGARYAGAETATIRALESYGQKAGVAFQIVDDVLDLVGTEREMGKTLGRDLQKGKPTLPVIHFMSTAPPDHRERFVAACTGATPRRQEQIEDWLHESIDYAIEIACRHVEAAVANLDCLPSSPAKESLVTMAEFILHRRT